MSQRAPQTEIAPQGPAFSRIILGLWRLAEWKMTPAQRVSFLQQALELGINTIDQADIYGDYQSELLLGEALNAAPELKSAFRFVSKCGICLPSRHRPAHTVHHYDTSRAHIIASAENSLQAMGIEQLDLLLIHRPDPLMDADEIAGAFLHLQQSGKVRHFGVSNFTTAQFDLLAARFPLVTNQLELSVLQQQALHDGTLDQCQRLRISPMIWSALGGGALFQQPAPNAQIARVQSELQRQSAASGLPASTIALSWVLQHPSKPLVLTGSGRIQALQQAVQACAHTLSRPDWFALWTASAGHALP